MMRWLPYLLVLALAAAVPFLIHLPLWSLPLGLLAVFSAGFLLVPPPPERLDP